MLRLIARQYVSGLRESGADKRQMGLNAFWIAYAFFVLPAPYKFYDTGTGAGIYLALAIPMAWCTLESVFCPIRMPKILFLCPMDAQMRQTYIRGTYRFKVVLHTLLGIVGAIVSMAFGNDWLGTLGAACNMLLYSLFGVGVDAAASNQGGEDLDISRWGRIAVRVIGCVLIIILQLIYVSAAVEGGILAQARWEQVLIGCLTALALLFAARYVGYWKTMQEEALFAIREEKL